MVLFWLSNLAFLAVFVWLTLAGASLFVWALWFGLWCAADYAVVWLKGDTPPNWAWGAILTALALVWGALSFGFQGV